MGGLSEKIKTIEVEGLTRIKQEELIDMISLHIGDAIDKETLRNGIKRAFKKGIFLDIKAVAEPNDSGIKLKYIVKEIPVIDKINIKGNEQITKKEIKKNFLFKEQENFKEGFLGMAKADLLNFYGRKGFPGADLKIEIEKGEAPGKIDINIMIEEGEPLIVRKINILPEAADRIRISEGDIYDIGRVEEDIEKLKKYYKKQKHIKPVVGPFEFKDGELIIPVIPGPRLEVIFNGNRDISSKKLSKEVSFLEDEEVNWDFLRETSRRIRNLYQMNGYDFAQVTGGIETKEDLITVIFFIFEGKRAYLRGIKFEGVDILPETIKTIIPMEEDKPFNRLLLTASKESITEFYNALGYLNTEVKEIKEDFREDGSAVYLTFVVVQGPQTRISEINIEGNKTVDISKIRDELHIKEGDPYNTVGIADARYRVMSLYKRAGYIDVDIEVESKISLGKAFVTFKITENESFVFGKTVIRGNEKTKNKIIMREFTIKEGEPYNYEELFNTRQKLYKLGLFSDISIKPLKTSNFKEQGLSAPADRPVGRIYKQDILVELKEANPGAVEISLGYGDYEKLRGIVDVSYSNLGGYNRKIGFRAESSSVNQRYILNFREPWLFNKPSLPLKILLTKENRRSVNLDSKETIYVMDRLSLLVGVEKELTERLKTSLDYEYSFTDTTDVKPGAILSREDTGTLGISSISPSLFYDARNNPFDPTTGSFHVIVLKVASGAFLSETEFIKATLQSSWFFPIKNRLVLALSFRGGVAYGLGETDDLPLVERFFLGGRNSVRGYKQDMLGPMGADNTPTGGNAFAAGNLEFRIPVGKGFGVAPFIDAGNVWRKVGDMDTALNYTAGIGLRYHTPVVPIRIDYGYKLNNRRGQSAGELHFSFGHAF
ncbi:MAG: outer membrane protein assembly factor BamA [Nitrospirota bacterium]